MDPKINKSHVESWLLNLMYHSGLFWSTIVHEYQKFDRFLPRKIIQTRYVGLSEYVLYIITQFNIFKHLVYKTFLGRNLSNFSGDFWKI